MLNERGHEVPDPTPVARPVRWTPPESLVDQIRRFVRQEFSQQAAAQGFETFEEADDFDVGDEPPDPQTRWELSADQEEYTHEPSGGPGAEPPSQEPAPAPGAPPAAAPRADAAPGASLNPGASAP